MSHHLIPNRFETLEQRGLVTNLCIPHMQTMLMCCFFLNQMKFQSGEKSLENTPQRLHLTDFVLIRQILLGLVNIYYPVIALDCGGPCTSETLCSSHGLDAEIKLEVASFFHIMEDVWGKQAEYAGVLEPSRHQVRGSTLLSADATASTDQVINQPRFPSVVTCTRESNMGFAFFKLGELGNANMPQSLNTLLSLWALKV